MNDDEILIIAKENITLKRKENDLYLS